MIILLDTCTFLWVISGADELSERARSLVADAANQVLLSAASAWEIGVKHALGKLPLPDDPMRFVIGERERHRIAALPIDEAAALNVGRLPALHRDPFDRMLVSQAVLGGYTILTPDRLITQYPAASTW
ncbi:MAG: type II toxin-antitoxin system VapC family toxin [Myxococcota bacterium]